ncbi:hypothetical protein ARC78_11705 [Stenotrophomonas pictorum JCM 9942]|uniref:Uncharacterized protein n=1 Tax=Stenotrophomonas pictorum JCM 9942 TaxID=1236960 RepID=A0A0R0AJ60_9GAMM|nr:hypothetical protein [Stenotrophomonas pictorum]KRG41249.1 hypothetical protein ARC78_11705 [Stenotrophomonas pictorum JCM 9942]
MKEIRAFPAATFGLTVTVNAGLTSADRTTVDTPFFVASTSQRFPLAPEQVCPSEVAQNVVVARRAIASERAACIAATISLPPATRRLWLIIRPKLGVAIAATMAKTATVTINSTRVNPSTRHLPIAPPHFRSLESAMHTLPIFTKLGH